MSNDHLKDLEEAILTGPIHTLGDVHDWIARRREARSELPHTFDPNIDADQKFQLPSGVWTDSVELALEAWRHASGEPLRADAVRACRSVFEDFEPSEVETQPPSIREVWHVGRRSVLEDAPTAAPARTPPSDGALYLCQRCGRALELQDGSLCCPACTTLQEQAKDDALLILAGLPIDAARSKRLAAAYLASNEEGQMNVLEDAIFDACTHCRDGNLPFQRGDAWYHEHHSKDGKFSRFLCPATELHAKLHTKLSQGGPNAKEGQSDGPRKPQDEHGAAHKDDPGPEHAQGHRPSSAARGSSDLLRAGGRSGGEVPRIETARDLSGPVNQATFGRTLSDYELELLDSNDLSIAQDAAQEIRELRARLARANAAPKHAEPAWDRFSGEACRRYDPWGCYHDETGERVHPEACRTCGFLKSAHRANAKQDQAEKEKP